MSETLNELVGSEQQCDLFLSAAIRNDAIVYKIMTIAREQGWSELRTAKTLACVMIELRTESIERLMRANQTGSPIGFSF